MLILSRRPGESVMVGEGIRVTVCGIKGRQVKLGFEAPAELRFIRDELAAGVPLCKIEERLDHAENQSAEGRR